MKKILLVLILATSACSKKNFIDLSQIQGDFNLKSTTCLDGDTPSINIKNNTVIKDKQYCVYYSSLIEFDSDCTKIYFRQQLLGNDFGGRLLIESVESGAVVKITDLNKSCESIFENVVSPGSKI